MADAEDRGQWLFARRNLEAGEFMCAYWGKPLLKNDSEKLKAAGKNAYCFTDGHNLFVDASDPLNRGNARYMNENHVDPNVILRRIYHNGLSHIVFKSSREVPKDQELCYDYGDTLAPWRGAIARHQDTNAIAARVATQFVRKGLQPA